MKRIHMAIYCQDCAVEVGLLVLTAPSISDQRVEVTCTRCLYKAQEEDRVNTEIWIG